MMKYDPLTYLISSTGLILRQGNVSFFVLRAVSGDFTYGCEIKTQTTSSAVQKELVFRLQLWKVSGLPAPHSEDLQASADKLHLRKCGLCLSRGLGSFC